MPELTVEHIPQLLVACREQATALAGTLNTCFGTTLSLEAGDPVPWQPDNAPSDLHGPGLLLALEFGEQAVLFALPESLPLPAWYLSPSATETSNLDSLAVEWASILLLPELTVSRQRTLVVYELLPELVRSRPLPGALLVPLRTAADPESPAVWLLGPVAQAPSPAASAAQPATGLDWHLPEDSRQKRTARTAVRRPILAAIAPPGPGCGEAGGKANPARPVAGDRTWCDRVV